MSSVSIELARASDVAAMVGLANWAAAHTIANFATQPESEDEWAQQFARTARTHPWLVARGTAGFLGFAKASPHRSRGAYAWSAEVSNRIRITSRLRVLR